MPILYASNGSRQESRSYVLNLLREKKRENARFVVADVGGSANSWADEVVDVYIDVVKGQSHKPTVVGDINQPQVWESLRQQYDKVDFLLCTHTLEDIRDPIFAIQQIQQVAKGGYISMPNKYAELTHVDSHYFVGWSHHRWIFSLVKENQDWVLHAMPKNVAVNYYSGYANHPWVLLKRLLHLTNKDKTRPSRLLPAVKRNKTIANLKHELGFVWENNFSFQYRDYFPSPDAYLSELRKFTEIGL